jgi:hypothetical protein
VINRGDIGTAAFLAWGLSALVWKIGRFERTTV